MAAPNASTTEFCLRSAIKFGIEISVAKFCTFMFNEFGHIVAPEEVKAIAKRVGYFVTAKSHRNRDVEVIRYTERSQRVRRGRPGAFVGVNIKNSVNAMLDEVMKPGEVRPTREVYGLLKQRYQDMKDVTSNKITVSLDPERYRVTTRTINHKSGRYIERLTDSSPDKLVKIGNTLMLRTMPVPAASQSVCV